MKEEGVYAWPCEFLVTVECHSILWLQGFPIASLSYLSPNLWFPLLFNLNPISQILAQILFHTENYKHNDFAGGGWIWLSRKTSLSLHSVYKFKAQPDQRSIRQSQVWRLRRRMIRQVCEPPRARPVIANIKWRLIKDGVTKAKLSIDFGVSSHQRIASHGSKVIHCRFETPPSWSRRRSRQTWLHRMLWCLCRKGIWLKPRYRVTHQVFPQV